MEDWSISPKETIAGPKLYRVVQCNQLWTSISSKAEILACLQMLFERLHEMVPLDGDAFLTSNFLIFFIKFVRRWITHVGVDNKGKQVYEFSLPGVQLEDDAPALSEPNVTGMRQVE
jgi:hypothetical protein